MKKVLSVFLILAVCILPLCACAKADPEKLSEAQLSYIQTESDKRIRQMDFQGAVYTSYQGEEIYSKATGKANKKEAIDNSVDIVYHFASVTKQFTAAAVLMLYDEGKLDLKDTLGKYFPDYACGKDITIHELMCMRSGIPDYVNINDESGVAAEMYSDVEIPFDIDADNCAEDNRKIIEEWIFAQPLLFTPGERYDYSSSNYLLLGEIVEQLTDEGYHAFVKSRIFDPLKMTSAGFVDDYSVEGVTVAKGYHSEGIEWADISGVRFAAWDMMCSPRDMAKWGEALISGELLSEESLKLMTTDYSTKDDPVQYCYALETADTEKSGKVYYHSGHFPSFYSMLLIIPEKKLVNVTVSNHSSENAPTLSARLCETVLKAIEEKYE